MHMPQFKLFLVAIRSCPLFYFIIYCISLVIFIFLGVLFQYGVCRRVVQVDSYYYIRSRTKMCEVECANIKKEPVSYVHVYVFMLQILL